MFSVRVLYKVLSQHNFQIAALSEDISILGCQQLDVTLQEPERDSTSISCLFEALGQDVGIVLKVIGKLFLMSAHCLPRVFV